MPIVAVGVLLSGFDLFVVNVALDHIAASIGGSNLSDLSWILNAYTITFAALLVPAGRIGDMVGSKRGFLTGLVIFFVASAFCAVSPNLWTLVAFRIVQAVGAAVMIPSSLGLVLAATPAERRAGAVRTWASLGGLGAALGPVVGGLLVQADWRWVFLINIPTGLAAAVLGWRLLPDTAESSGQPARHRRRPRTRGDGRGTGDRPGQRIAMGMAVAGDHRQLRRCRRGRHVQRPRRPPGRPIRSSISRSCACRTSPR